MKSALRALHVAALFASALGPDFTQAQTQSANATGNGCAVNAASGAVVSINCPGVPPEVNRALERQFELRLKDKDAQLKDKDTQLKQFEAEANAWRDKYILLLAQLAQPGIDLEQRRKAQQLITEGRFDEAGRLLDRIIENREPLLTELAHAYYDRASLYELQFRLPDALEYYAKAYRCAPDNLTFGIAYADLLRRQNFLFDAEVIYVALLQSLRKSEPIDPNGLSELAIALNNLATVYDDTKRLDEAERLYNEALEISRPLARASPRFLPLVTATLNNLGGVYGRTRRHDDAERTFKEILEVYRELERTNPSTYSVLVAVTLDNLGGCYLATQRLTDAERIYTEALEIHRKLVKEDPAAYRSGEAMTLSNLGALYHEMHRFEDARQVVEEAVQIRRELTQLNPAANRTYLVVALMRLSALYRDLKRSEDAEYTYQEAQGIQREFEDAARRRSGAPRPGAE